jgi:hypothetical protein
VDNGEVEDYLNGAIGDRGWIYGPSMEGQGGLQKRRSSEDWVNHWSW